MNLGNLLLNTIFPSLCPLCQNIVEKEQTLCALCWDDIEFISDPSCIQCGLPLPASPIEEEIKCYDCLKNNHIFTESKSVFVYEAHSKKMILSLKHSYKFHYAPLLGKWMAESGKSLIEKSDVLIPIPLHWSRLLKRGFNQAALLAHHVGRAAKKPVLYNVLKRAKKTPTQDGLSRAERQKNMNDVFAVKEKNVILNKNIMLIDDVMTTGATLDAAAQILVKNGAASVRTLTVGRVRPTHKHGA